MGGGIMFDENKIKTKSKRKRNEISDRVSLSSKAFYILSKWRVQIIEDTNEVLKPTLSDLANFKLEDMNSKLSSTEIKAFRSRHLTWQKKLAWVEKMAKAMEKNGQTPNMDQLWKDIESAKSQPAKRQKINDKNITKSLPKAGSEVPHNFPKTSISD